MLEVVQMVRSSLTALEIIGMTRDSVAPSVFQNLEEDLPDAMCTCDETCLLGLNRIKSEIPYIFMKYEVSSWC